MRVLQSSAVLLLSCIAFSACYDYKLALQDSLLFYEAQRSGKLPADQKVTWRKDSALNDKGNNGEDLTGGYYDDTQLIEFPSVATQFIAFPSVAMQFIALPGVLEAFFNLIVESITGDFVKFGFPMAFTATSLAWSVLDHASGYTSASALDDAHKAIKWATDYFIKAHVSEFEFYGQVGQGQVDHDYWGRPEDMTMARPAYMISTSAPGSDLAAETAAALAAASLVFKTVDSSYSATLLQHAIQLFNFANTYRGIYSNSITDANSFYRSSSYEDELVWGAAWLYRATNDNQYLSVVNELYSGIQYNDGFGWDSKKSGADVSYTGRQANPSTLSITFLSIDRLIVSAPPCILSIYAVLYRLTKDATYSGRLTAYCDYTFNSAPKTPKGLIFLGDWGSLRNIANAVFICLEAASLGINADTYRSGAKTQIDYMLGDGGHSYVVGYGDNYPTHAHHRSSSCPDAPAVCDWNLFNSDTPNYHVLYGALVGGPGSNDDYIDTRQDAQHNEVACDYNSAYQGALSILVELGY
uniref:cellulase n=1 Tax=Timema poppense TaxID=170557 RepID=A0A7R9CT83_TIMPO|nr:unnamed protein product [Timema poppensis]